MFRNDAEPEAQDEAANDSDDSAADGIVGDHGGQHECQDDQGCAALPVAVSRPNTIPAPPTRSAAVKNTRPGSESRSR